MARFYNLYLNRLDPLAQLHGFLDDDYWRTEFAKRLEQEPAGYRQPACYLDYMIVWLVEGPAGLLFASYEDWLLAVIRFADDIYSPRSQYGHGENVGEPLGLQLQLGGTRENSRTGLLNWGKRSMDHEANESHVNSVDMEDFYLPEDADGMNHPALDRNVFERCRQHALRMEQLDSFRDLQKEK